MASLVFTALVSAQVVCGDWPTIFTKNMKAPLIEPINEPLNNASPYEQVHYSVANLSNDFKSSTKFQPRGMAHLYELTEKFINFISDGEAFPEGSYYLNIVSFAASSVKLPVKAIPLIADNTYLFTRLYFHPHNPIYSPAGGCVLESYWLQFLLGGGGGGLWIADLMSQFYFAAASLLDFAVVRKFSHVLCIEWKWGRMSEVREYISFMDE